MSGNSSSFFAKGSQGHFCLHNLSAKVVCALLTQEDAEAQVHRTSSSSDPLGPVVSGVPGVDVSLLLKFILIWEGHLPGLSTVKFLFFPWEVLSSYANIPFLKPSPTNLWVCQGSHLQQQLLQLGSPTSLLHERRFFIKEHCSFSPTLSLYLFILV